MLFINYIVYFQNILQDVLIRIHSHFYLIIISFVLPGEFMKYLLLSHLVGQDCLILLFSFWLLWCKSYQNCFLSGCDFLANHQFLWPHGDNRTSTLTCVSQIVGTQGMSFGPFIISMASTLFPDLSQWSHVIPDMTVSIQGYLGILWSFGGEGNNGIRRFSHTVTCQKLSFSIRIPWILQLYFRYNSCSNKNNNSEIYDTFQFSPVFFPTVSLIYIVLWFTLSSFDRCNNCEPRI